MLPLVKQRRKGGEGLRQQADQHRLLLTLPWGGGVGVCLLFVFPVWRVEMLDAATSGDIYNNKNWVVSLEIISKYVLILRYFQLEPEIYGKDSTGRVVNKW